MSYLPFSLRVLLLGSCLAISLSAPPIFAQDGESALRQQLLKTPDNIEAELKLADLLLENMRKLWAQRDPSATGPALQEQSDEIQRRCQELITLYEKVLSQQPGHVEARVNLAEVYGIFLSRYDQAETLLKQALETDPKNPKALVAAAEYQFFFQNDHAGALNRLEQALKEQPNEPALTISLADLLTGASQKPEDFLRARELLETALKAHPGHHGLGYMLASVWYRDASLSQPMNPEKADTALKLFLAELDAKPEFELVIEVAQVAQSMGRLPQAREIVSKGIKEFPGEPRLRLLLGDLWLQQGATSLDQGQFSPEAQKAEGYYRDLLKPADFKGLVTAQQIQLYYNLGLLAFLKGQTAKDTPSQALGFYQDAEKLYRQAIAIFDRINIINRPLQQDLAKTLEAMGQIQAGQSRQAEALQYYQQACDLKLESSCNWLKDHGMGQ